MANKIRSEFVCQDAYSVCRAEDPLKALGPIVEGIPDSRSPGRGAVTGGADIRGTSQNKE